jgi:hypothetical protein
VNPSEVDPVDVPQAAPVSPAAESKRPWTAPAFTTASVTEVTKSTAGSGDDMDGRS